MTDRHDVHAIARGIVGSGLYLVLGTSDEAGTPWVSPVYYANDGWATFLWISSPQAQHSRNISMRSRVGIVIFDSGAPISTGQAVYMTAEAGLEPGAATDRRVEVPLGPEDRPA
jgi:hypothetical protein